MLSIKIALTARVMTTKLAENKAERESLIMRKQGYVIIGIGLAVLAGVFWLSQLSKEETLTTAAKPPSPSEETAVDSKTEKPINPFAGMRRQSPEIEPLSEEDKELMAKREDWEKKREAYENSPRGNYLEGFQDRSPPWIEDMPPEIATLARKANEEEMAKYKALDAAGKAIFDLDNWLSRQTSRRISEHCDAMFEKAMRTGNPNLYRPQDLPNSTATIAEAKAQDAINKIQTGWETDPEPWQEVAAFLRDRRNFSQTELNQGDPADPNWHADHIQWIEQTAQTIGIPLDNPDDESWIQEKIAAAKEQRYQDLDAPLIEELKKIDEEMAAAAEAWAREPDNKDKEVATRHNQLIKQDRKQRAQQEHERRYREEMERNPVFKEMERERQRKERTKARQAEEPAQETPTSSESE